MWNRTGDSSAPRPLKPLRPGQWGNAARNSITGPAQFT